MDKKELEIAALKQQIAELQKRIEYLEGPPPLFEEHDNEEDFINECYECGGLNDEHEMGCPNDDSPFARLLRDGYD